MRQGCLRLFCRCELSHKFKPVWICEKDRSDKILSQWQWFSHVTRGNLLQQPVVATCHSDLSHRVSRPLYCTCKIPSKLIVRNHLLKRKHKHKRIICPKGTCGRALNNSLDLYPWLTSRLICDQHWINSHLIVGWVSSNSWATIENVSTPDWLSTEMLIKCQPRCR